MLIEMATLKFWTRIEITYRKYQKNILKLFIIQRSIDRGFFDFLTQLECKLYEGLTIVFC